MVKVALLIDSAGLTIAGASKEELGDKIFGLGSLFYGILESYYGMISEPENSEAYKQVILDAMKDLEKEMGIKRLLIIVPGGEDSEWKSGQYEIYIRGTQEGEMEGSTHIIALEEGESPDEVYRRFKRDVLGNERYKLLLKEIESSGILSRETTDDISELLARILQ